MRFRQTGEEPSDVRPKNERYARRHDDTVRIAIGQATPPPGEDHLSQLAECDKQHGRPKGQMQLLEHVDDEKGRGQVVHETPAADENEYRAEPAIFEWKHQKTS